MIKTLLYSFLLISFELFAREEVVRRSTYVLSYNTEHEVANWVSYDLDHSKLRDCASRSNNFRPDPLVESGTATNADYKNSGYDRGHLLPAGDMKFSKTAMGDTFYYSNITPQPANFNRGRWKQLENLVRAWGLKYEKVWIVTGPILKDNLRVIGKEKTISIPEQYFKAIIKKTGNTYSGIGFLMSTGTPHTNLDAYVTTIKEIEDLTNTDFFEFLSSSERHEAEELVDFKDWDFKAKFEYLPCK